MTDEVNKAVDAVKQQEAKPEEKKIPNEPQYTDIEQRAMEMGWRPKEDFSGEEDDFIDAKEFVRRKPLFDKIETQSKEIKNVRKAIEALQTHYTAREEAAVKNAITKLKEARQEAITNADGEAFDRIDDEIKRVEKEADRLKAIDTTQKEPELHPDFVAWSKRNNWYNDTGYMRKWADDYGLELASQGLTPLEVLKKVEQAVKKEFAHKFTNPNKASAPDVEASGRSKGNTGSDKFQLSEQEEKVMKTLVSTKVMTKEAYIAQVKAMRGDK